MAPSQNPSVAPSMNPSVAPSQNPCNKNKTIVFQFVSFFFFLTLWFCFFLCVKQWFLFEYVSIPKKKHYKKTNYNNSDGTISKPKCVTIYESKRSTFTKSMLKFQIHFFFSQFSFVCVCVRVFVILFSLLCFFSNSIRKNKK